MFKPRTFIHLAAFGLASILFGDSALHAQIAVGPTGPQGGGNAVLGDSASRLRNAKGRNSPKQDYAAGRIDWWRKRFAGELGPDFMALVMGEAERQRQLYPEQFPPDPAPMISLPEGVPLPLAANVTTWTNLGPTKSNKIQNGNTRTDVNSGRLRTILPDPTDPNILYVLTSGGGLWKTNNLLSSPPTWRFLSDRIGSTMGGSVAFGRTNTGSGTVLYLGLGDAFDSGVGGFVAKSSDAGGTWASAIQLTGATRVLDLKVDTSQGTTTTSDIVLVGTNNGLFRSTDGGTTYAAVADPDVSGKKIWSIVRTSAGWLASTQTISSPRIGALVISTDRGATWSPVANQIPTSTVFPPTSYPISPGRMTLAVGAPGDATVYIFAAYSLTNAVGGFYYNDYDQYDLFYSTDSGSTAWKACHITVPSTGTNKTPGNPNTDQGDMDLMGGQAFYNHLILVDPTDATRNTVYLGGNLSSARSSNAKAASFGSTWTLMTNWLPRSTFSTMPYAHADFHCGAFTNAGGTPRLLLGNDGGLAIGTGATWNTWDHSKNIGINSHLIYAMVSGPLNNCDANSVLIGLQDNGTHNRIGDTSVFDQTYGGDGFGVGWSQASNAISLGSYVFNDIYGCTANPPDDQNTKWTVAFTTGLGITGSGPSNATSDNGASYYFVTPIITAPAGADPTGNVFYTYGNDLTGPNSGKIFKGNAANATIWSVIGTPGSGGISAGRYVQAGSHGIGAHPTDPNRLAAAGSSGVLLITTNGGTNWTERALNSLVPASGGRTWQGLNASPAWVDNLRLFVCSESTTATSIHVAKSIDGGVNWAAADTGLPTLPVAKIVVDPGDATGNTLYAATWLGVYRTLNGGTNWSLFGTGLPQSLVTDLYIHPTSSFLRASIWGRGVWQVGPTPTYSTPTFGIQPSGGSFTPGTPFSLSGTISNAYPALTYQWRRNGVNLSNGGTETISGATTSSLTITNPSCSSAGDYTLVATNCVGITISNAATMTTTAVAPVITAQPANVRWAQTASFALQVTATGTGLLYQWKKGAANVLDGGRYSGATTATLSFTSVANGDAGTVNGNYTCVVTNSAGCSVTSAVAIVNSGATPVPNLVSSPTNLTVTAPTSASFSVTAGGGGANTAVSLSFMWRKGGANLTNGGTTTWTSPISVNINNNATQAKATSTLTLNPTADASAGVYDCVVTSTGGSVTSGAATLTVNRRYTPATAVSITSSVPSATFGTPVTFTAGGSGSLISGTATAAPASAYQYQFWVYLDDALGWTMVQDYSAANTYVMPGTTQPGGYGVGVDCRTSPTVLWDIYNSIDVFNVTPIAHGPLGTTPFVPATSNRPKFTGRHTSINNH